MRVLVTGGAGFIGSNFIRHLLARDSSVQVTNLDKLTYAGNPANLRDVEDDPRYTFVKGDICDAGGMAEAVAGHDAVVNFAAESHVDRSIVDGADVVRTNTLGVAVLCEAARRAGVGRILQVGTDEEYGSIAEGSNTEEDPLSPASPYAAGKAGGSLVALAFARTHGLDVVVTRCTNNYGPYQYPEKLIPLFLTNLLEGRPVPLYAGGGQVRDWLYVADHCAALELVLRRGRAATIYNIGANTDPARELSNLELTRRLLAALGLGEEMIADVADRPGHDRRYSLDTTRIRTELGWAPRTSLEDGLRVTIAWYRANAEWWRPLRQAG